MISTVPLHQDSLPFDIILISGDYYADHPHSGVGVIARVLDAEGYRVGIIEKPRWETVHDFMTLGMPRLCFGVSSGAIDSMLQNYTPLKKSRGEDPYKPFTSGIPDRAVIVYSQKVREAQKKMIGKGGQTVPIIIGGVEASLRRLTHYDYWDNKPRRPILFDAKADILVYGPGEYQIKEILHRLDAQQSIEDIAGTCIITPTNPEQDNNTNFHTLPSYEAVKQDKKAFCTMQMAFSNQRNLVQPVGNRFVVQYRMHHYTTEELDALYDLPFTYIIPEKHKELEMAQFSIITHRGCFGNCSFCAIALHQGTKIVSRSEDNILREIERMTKLPAFKGYIGDLGAASANMYGMDCAQSENCLKQCLSCPIVNLSHDRSTDLLKRSRHIQGIKKVFVRSGVRYDLAIEEDAYLNELIEHHVSGNLKIAPEHFSPHVCALMNKPNDKFEEFREKFDKINAKVNKSQSLKYYFITAHPGSTMKDAAFLGEKIRELGYKNTESIQIFTPTPMSIAACMYYTGLNPSTLEKVYVPWTYKEKKEQKRILYPQSSPRNRAPKKTHRKNQKSR